MITLDTWDGTYGYLAADHENNLKNFLLHRVFCYPLGQWCTTSGPRATSGPRRVLMWPAKPNKKSDYFRAAIHIKSTVDHKSSTLNKLTTIFNLTSLDLSCSLRQNKYFSIYVEVL